jgi:hypothetical protein
MSNSHNIETQKHLRNRTLTQVERRSTYVDGMRRKSIRNYRKPLIFVFVGHFLLVENSSAPLSVGRTVRSSNGNRKLWKHNMEGVPNDVPETSSIHQADTFCRRAAFPVRRPGG